MAVNEILTLNGLALNSGPEPAGAYTLEALDLTPPKKKPEWAQGADSDGAGLIRDPLFENRTVTAKIRIEPQTTMNVALEKLAAIVDQLQEASKNPGGIPLVWTPSNSTKTMTFYALEGEPTGLPIEMQGDQSGWFVKAPIMTVQIICKPFGYGPEEEVQAAVANETGLSIVTFTLANIKGDVPAEGRLVIADTAAIGRRFVEWGLENRYYNAATKLVLDSEDMTPVGGAQSTEPTGAYKRAGATKNTILTNLLPEPTICCSTGNLSHVGTFRVKARVLVAVGGGRSLAAMRLSWQEGEGPYRANAWTSAPLANTFTEVDLGVITIPPATEGTQRWSGRIEAYSDFPAAFENLYIDYLTFVPVLEGYGKARGIQGERPGTVQAYDNLSTGTLSGSLNARTPPVGAAWATSGAATDWTVAAGKLTRSTISDSGLGRFGVLGSALTGMRVTVGVTHSDVSLATGLSRGVVARWTNSTNYAWLSLVVASPETLSLNLGVVVAGVSTLLTSTTFPMMVSGESDLILLVNTDGSAYASIAQGGAVYAEIGAYTAVLATGGTLASGKGGILDFNPSAVALVGARVTNSIAVTQLPSIPFCIQPSRSMQVRSDSALTTDSGGTIYGPLALYRGSRFYVPQAGAEKRTSRVIVKADRNDLETNSQPIIGDAFTAQCFVTPRYHVIPR
jgi:hypothetical protein